MRTIHIKHTRLLFDYLTQTGIHLDAPHKQEILNILDHLNDDSRRPIEEWDEMATLAERALPSRDVCLELAEYIGLTDLGVLGYVAMASANLKEALELLAQFFPLLNNVYGLEVALLEGRLVVRMLPLVEKRFPRLERLTLATMCWHSRLLCLRADLQFDVGFAFPASPQVPCPLYTKTFGGDVSFDAATSCLSFPPGAEALQLPTSNHRVQKALLSELMQRMTDVDEARTTFPQLVQQRITAAVKDGEVSLEVVAATLGMSPRTVQSRLEAHGYSFRVLLDRSRHTLALVYLADPHLSLVELANMLGFSSQPSFNRAFLRWAGVSPGEYRKTRMINGQYIGGNGN